jgi:hypothetical protein
MLRAFLLLLAIIMVELQFDLKFAERKYSFSNQYVAMVLRRYYSFVQNPASLVFVFLPTILVSSVFFGVMKEDANQQVSKHLLD